MENYFRPSPNSFKNTFCVFQEMPMENTNNLKIQYDSKSGSKYYYTELGMYRLSNHWGRLANSKWRLEPLQPETSLKFKLGFALWENFYPDNAIEELYYLEVNFEKNTVNYQHKNNPQYDGKAFLRTTFETTKRIKQVRNIMYLTSWAKYLENDDIDYLRENISAELIYSNKTLEQIKKEFM
ncbi:hypothetical protein SAMN05444372_105227 [Flavobacterium micromati]|uniref:Uncharacterized protein n=1 Tax=Flavobacterium micromati TaxID=229205 RepID=A0A1M5JJV3_9FLAO|nr:hypothetical protein [Flavobacterium micromati]SHG40798.1 hypothetical protein SAMN05444372_105227 [Flavobacterium micromati]